MAMRFGYVTPQIAIGGAINERSTYDQMQEWLGGITHIICLTRLCQHRFDDDDKAEILHYYIHDGGQQMPYGYWEATTGFALDVLKNPDNKLLIHCAAGRNRSTSVAYAVLRCEGYSKINAELLILKKYAKKMYEQERHLKNDGAYKPLASIRYQDQIDVWFHETRWLNSEA